ncbi:MAG: type II secretion system F family protein [Thermoplasmata archaeon]|nr:type II secretion system F family protein [Thermoplasmata archaeon]MCI4359745.1 type II secretion system F family protein [Thermoplasmata archaeon]
MAITTASRGKPLPSDDNATLVRVKRGSQPSFSTLSPFQRWAWRTFRARVLRRPPSPSLDESLARAHLRMRGDEYLAQVYGMTLIIGLVLAVLGGVLFTILFLSGQTILGLALGVLVPVAITPLLFLLLQGQPASTAKSRGRKIDAKISSAMSFVSAMASADVNIDQIFRELARQKIYGQVAEEAAWITRDTELLGVDILTALKDGATRTPSKRWQEFLQGVVTTATSGGQLKPYFLLKAEQFEQEHKLEMLRRVETMGLFAETFVTVVVAFPLFLVIIIAIFAIIGSGGSFMILVLYLIVGIMIPVSQVGFIIPMQSLASEV